MRTVNKKVGHAAWMALAFALTSACGEEAAETPTPEATEAAEVAEVAEAPPPAVTPETVLPPPTAEALAGATDTGAIAREIDAEPARAAAILAAHELEVDAFEARLFEIAAHPALTQAYATARTATE
jgi:hypothetical protein